MVYLTGDTHGQFIRIEEFCAAHSTTAEDVMVILGDAGFNFFLDLGDELKKHQVSQLPITVFCIHGNHEERPYNVPGYKTMEWRGGKVWYEPDFPNILFADDGEIYDFGDKKAIAIGGAYSVDKWYRLRNGYPWFESEQPDDVVKARVEAALDRVGWKVDYVFSHTVPYDFEPRHMFLSGIDQSTVDQSTELWLGEIEKKLQYEHWYAGHFHCSWSVDRVQLLFEDYVELAE